MTRQRGREVSDRIAENSGPADAATGCIPWTGWTHDGYAALTVGQDRLLVFHHLLGPTPEGMVREHRCRNRACVNPEHLRFIPDYGNAQNRPARAGSKSGHRGVTQQKNGTWQARCMVDGESHSLGTFGTVEEAAAAASEGRKRLMPFAIEAEA